MSVPGSTKLRAHAPFQPHFTFPCIHNPRTTTVTRQATRKCATSRLRYAKASLTAQKRLNRASRPKNRAPRAPNGVLQGPVSCFTYYCKDEAIFLPLEPEGRHIRPNLIRSFYCVKIKMSKTFKPSCQVPRGQKKTHPRALILVLHIFRKDELIFLPLELK